MVAPADVADLLAQRVLTKDGNPGGTFSADTVPTDTQVIRLIAKVTAEETGGLGTIPSSLTDMHDSLIALSTAVRVLGVYFSGDAARDDLDADTKDLRERFRRAIDTINTTGDPNAVSAEDGAGAGVSERPPYPRGQFPTLLPAPVFINGVPATNLTERY